MQILLCNVKERKLFKNEIKTTSALYQSNLQQLLITSYNWDKEDHITLNFLEAVFHKFYLVHS